MKNIVLIPAWQRADFLSVMLDHIKAANGADRNVYVFAIDRSYSGEVDYVAKTFPLEKIIRYDINHRFKGNTHNLLEGYKYCLSLMPKYQSNLVYLVEEDIFVGKDFFDFHERVQSKFNPFCVSAVRNQNDPRMLAGELGFDPAAVYNYGKYQSLGVSWKAPRLQQIVQHARVEYYSSMDRYLVRTFPKSTFGTMWTEQDGLINRIMEAGKHDAIFPVVPRAYHAGFVGYNRKGANLQGSLEERVARLKSMTADEMNSHAASYKDITKIDTLMDYGIKEFFLIP